MCDTPFDTSVFVPSIVIIISTIMASCCCEGVRIASKTGRMIYHSCFSCWAATFGQIVSESFVMMDQVLILDVAIYFFCVFVCWASQQDLFSSRLQTKVFLGSKIFDLLNPVKILWRVNHMANSLFISVKEAPHFVISTLIHNPFQTHHEYTCVLVTEVRSKCWLV